jgi:hypothetical protein
MHPSVDTLKKQFIILMADAESSFVGSDVVPVAIHWDANIFWV